MSTATAASTSQVHHVRRGSGSPLLLVHDLLGVDVVGSSMGARLALELARRGEVGATVALDPGGFWSGGERWVFGTSVALSIRLVRALGPLIPFLTGNPVTRTLRVVLEATGR